MNDNQAEEWFTGVYERLYGRLHAYAARRVGRDLADEIVAETFLIAWRRIERMPSDNPLPWLYGIARNVVLRQRSASARERSLQLALDETKRQIDSPPDNDLDLWQAWEALSPADREVLRLIAWEELSVAEAAQAMGCAAPVLSVRLHRARRRLQRLLRRAQSTSRSSMSSLLEA